MTTDFVERAGMQTPARRAASAQFKHALAAHDIELVRLSWCDLHGTLRTKTLTVAAAIKALDAGVSMVSMASVLARTCTAAAGLALH